jgi:hypothetical protein
MLPANAAGAARVRALVGDASEITPPDTWPEPDMRLIRDDRPPAPKLSNDVLPTGWEEWIVAEAEACACPRDYVACGLISASSAAIGNARRIAATADWSEPANLWFGLIGPPSTGKTPALRPMINATRKLERDGECNWRTTVEGYKRDAEAADAVDKAWREAVRAAVKEGKTPPDRPPQAEAPTKPPMPRVMAMNSTTQKLQRLLAENPRGLLYVRDELAGWIGGFDRYGGNGDDRAFFLETWNAGPYVCDRVKDDAPVKIEHALLSVIGGMVPDRLREVLTDADDGLVERILLCWPDPEPIAPLCERGSTDAATRSSLLNEAVRRLHTLQMGTDNHGIPAPRALPLDREARKLFDEQRQEQMQRARDASGFAAGWYGKNPGRLLRLALVFEHLTWAARTDGAAQPASVSADAVVRAGGFVDYATAMFERVVAGLAISRAQADAAQIARHVQAIAGTAPRYARLKPLNERSLYQRRGFAWARDRKRRGDAFAVLQDDGWLRPAQVNGHARPRGDWQVNPRILDAKQ